MNIEQLLAILSNIEAVSKDTISGIRSAYEQATRESDAWKKRADKAEASVTRLNELLGGSDKDAKTALENLQRQVTELTTDRDKYKTEAEKLKADIKRTEKLDQLGAIATRIGIDRDGLAAMLKGGMLPEDKTVVEGEGDKAVIKIDGKEIKDYLKAYPYLERALIPPSPPSNGQETPTTPTNNQTPSAPPVTPTGGTNGGTNSKDPTLNAIAELGFVVPTLAR